MAAGSVQTRMIVFEEWGLILSKKFVTKMSVSGDTRLKPII